MVYTRRTQKGEMIVEVKKDPSVKCLAYRELMAKSLESEANVGSLSQEAVRECKDLDEITTTEEEQWFTLDEQCNVDVPMQIRITKAFGGTHPVGGHSSTLRWGPAEWKPAGRYAL